MHNGTGARSGVFSGSSGPERPGRDPTGTDNRRPIPPDTDNRRPALSSDVKRPRRGREPFAGSCGSDTTARGA